MILLNKTAKRPLERPISLVQPILHYIIHASRCLSPMNTLFFHLERPNNTWRAILSFLFTPHIVTLGKAAWREVLKIYRNRMVLSECLYIHRIQVLRPLLPTLVNKLHRIKNSGNINSLSILRACSFYFYHNQSIPELQTICSFKWLICSFTIVHR